MTNDTATDPGPSTPTDAEDRFTRGARIQAQLDPGLTDSLRRALADIAPDFARYTVEFPFGDIYARPGLDLRARQIATIAALTTLGEQRRLEAHLRFALNIGVPREEIVEVLIQMAVYAGWPRAINALYTARDLFLTLDRSAAESAQAAGADRTADS
ncbi:carboxymuconolactone decarboxylase family protein [Modestobacter sp. VKM Ac-2983]|uniref:carboxymuconolactone decarboxylase family protein n=1 Tax=Modestobacter sp. VKM Ac-2983 TaxID=3004137 RepID=UPI0022ABC048|nr:carboxymuconolactone decarboxylase family protein [Modestobacter sp. VKM Ac-2983]MCZ2805746.1 carboxymuconolactone decarboxylase family protein [Modestobacter sp. VKM Ac-2983]